MALERRCAEVVAALIVGLALTGCGTAPTRQPPPDQHPGRLETPALQLPARPRPLKLGAVEPCSLLAGPAVADLGVGPGNPHGITSRGTAAQCQWSTLPGRPPGSYIVRSLQRRAGSATTESLVDGVIWVAGYPAVRASTSGNDLSRECVLYVDIADDRSLLVEYLRGLDDQPGSRDDACLNARRAADYMVRSLMTSSSGPGAAGDLGG